jgi:hypothetical protein
VRPGFRFLLQGNAAIGSSLSNSTRIGAQIVQQSTLRTPSAEASFLLHALRINRCSDGRQRSIAVESNDPDNAQNLAAVSDRTLRSIVEQGFFGGPGSLAYARSACAELIFARAIIEAQTAKIEQLSSASLLEEFNPT